jgi:hypothetical protein
MAGIAIAEGMRSIAQVTGDVVQSSDFTSRVRTPRVGQLALLANMGGCYSALEPSKSRLRAAGQTIARVAGKVAKWIGGNADAAADEFAKTAGKTAGKAAVLPSLAELQRGSPFRASSRC